MRAYVCERVRTLGDDLLSSLSSSVIACAVIVMRRDVMM